MADQSKTSRSLSEISHLFLSSVRQRQTAGAAAPARKPPPATEARHSIDLTPEEFQEVFAPTAPIPAKSAAADPEIRQVPPVSALILSHLSNPLEAAKRYARNLAATGRRIGLIVIDAAEFRLFTFDLDEEPSDEPQAGESACFDVRAMTDAINELNCDLDSWLIAALNPRAPEARGILRELDRWIALSACDHEGVVSCYRSLKGLAGVHPSVPVLSLAVLDAKDPADPQQVHQKLFSVCGQFLQWPLSSEPPVGDAFHVAEVAVMSCRAAGDKAQLAVGAHWRVVSDLAIAAKAACPGGDSPAVAGPVEPIPSSTVAAPRMSIATDQPQTEPRIQMTAVSPQATHDDPPVGAAMSPADDAAQVIELADGNALLDAIMAQTMAGIIECPLRPPMCPQARLAVDRQRRILLIAAPGRGLRDLRSIGLAFRWVNENRALLAMALPQFALDPLQHPHLRLLVDQGDLEADVLQPLFQVNTVSVHSYRKVRWGQRNGLLLEAA